MMYVFMSFGSIHTGKNLGCCIVQVEKPEDANEHCRSLGLMPDTCNQGRVYILPDEAAFKDQGMELNRLYSPDEMDQMGFSKG